MQSSATSVNAHLLEGLSINLSSLFGQVRLQRDFVEFVGATWS